MGLYTVTQILSAGFELAGDPSLNTVGLIPFNTWLQRKYAEFDAYKSLKNYSVTLTVGTDNVTVTDASLRILDIIAAYLISSSTNTPAYELFKLPSTHNRPERVPGAQSGAARGKPREYEARDVGTSGTGGTAKLYLFPTPDVAYTLNVEAKVGPPILTTPDTDKPQYPNDETMIQWAKCYALDHMDKPERLAQERQQLAVMEAKDRALFQGNSGVDNALRLDPDTYGYNPGNSVYGPVLTGQSKVR